VGRHGEERARVDVQPVSALEEILEGGFLEVGRTARRGGGAVSREGVEHPRLCVELVLFLDEGALEVAERPLQHLLVHADIGIPRQDQSPDHVGRHEGIARSGLPPAEAPIAVLEVGQPGEPATDHGVELVQIAGAARMGLGRVLRLDAAEDSADHVLPLQPQLRQRPGGDDRGEKAAHGLLGAAVRILDQVGKGVEHGHRQARCHQDLEPGGTPALWRRRRPRHAR
jgi:hypothetical protein